MVSSLGQMHLIYYDPTQAAPTQKTEYYFQESEGNVWMSNFFSQLFGIFFFNKEYLLFKVIMESFSEVPQ